MNKLILASASPRRRELLQSAKVEFEVVPSPAGEVHDETIDFRTLCEINAELKARAVADLRPESWVLGADTLVSINGALLGKPANADRAREMLRQLSGRTNQVCTGVCLFGPDGRKVLFHELSEVVFLSLSDHVIDEYMSRVNTLDKAGGYAAQECGEMIIAEIRGDFTNVVGLPMTRLLRELALISQYSF
jgi:septum formation protein